MTAPLWRIYYIDRDVKTFDSTMGSPLEAPAFGVGLIVQRHDESGRQVVMRHDRYFFRTDDNAWWGADREDMWDYLYHYLDVIGAVKQGRSCSDAYWQNLVLSAKRDEDFPALSRPWGHEQATKQPTSARGKWSGFGK